MTATYQRLLHSLDSPYAIYCILGLGMILRLLALVVRAHLPLVSDASGYDAMALQLLHGERFSPYWPPGLPYYLAFAHGALGPGAIVARASMLCVYVACSFLLYGYGKLISTRTAGNMAALVFAIYPACISCSVEPLTELPAATLILAIVWTASLACDQVSMGLSAFTGFLLGLLELVRPASILLLIAAPLFFLLRTRKICMALLCLVTAVILLSSWLRKAHEMTGRFIWINEANAMNFFLGNNPYTPLYKTWPGGQAELGFPDEFMAIFQEIQSKPPATRDALYRRIALHHILSRPDLFAVRTFNRMRVYFAFPTFRATGLASHFQNGSSRGWMAAVLTCLNAVIYWPIMILAIWSLFRRPQEWVKPGQCLLISGSVLLYSLPYWLVFSNPRLHFPVLPLFIILAAMLVADFPSGSGAETIKVQLLSLRRRRALTLALALFVYIQLEWAWIK
ncbi:MAG TPA: glycosyltransferase family 39 protein [Terriglobia bacterium]|nr:glycosyltransferase family 39 protein [Terriglobia bacterium]